MVILGINAYHGDAAAAVVVDGHLVAAAEEERFNRIKHSAGFPAQALRYCLREAGVSPHEVAIVAVARAPRARLVRKLLYAARMPRRALERLRVQGKFTRLPQDLARAFDVDSETLTGTIHRVEHHAAHLASTFFVSPFDEAALFSVDGLGDFASAMWGVGRGHRIFPAGSIGFPHSLGIFYTALTQYLGFPKYGDEYKVMGLASYGAPEFLEEFRRIVRDVPGGAVGFQLGLDYFVHDRDGVEMTWGDGEPTIGRLYSDFLVSRIGPARNQGAPIEAVHRNVAASLQRRLEEVLLDNVRTLQQRTRLRKLCLAGGVAFNCVANGKILKNTGFEEVYVQSAAGDAGLAIGAAMYVWHQHLGNPRSFMMEHAYWGPEFGEDAIREAIGGRRAALEQNGVSTRRIDTAEELCRWTGAQLATGKVIGWFQGRMEWGPRALGNRSILADPRRPEMRDILNTKIKRREMFRPFAPSILETAAAEYFEQSYPSPFMLMTYRVRPEKRCAIPATTHVDGTGRLQTVNAQQNEIYYTLLQEFGRQTGVPVLLNTSFNENEPVVCSPDEAVNCFLRTRMDALVLGCWVLEREPSSCTG
ncbi:MAG: carbamoyltransferase [Candidatus Binatia bacterium]